MQVLGELCKVFRAVEPPWKRAMREGRRDRIKAKYGVETGWMDIARAEDELQECNGCTGTCLKSSFRYSKPIIRVVDSIANISSTLCIYGRQRELERNVHSSRIPARYVGKTLDDYEQDEQNSLAVDFAKDALNSAVGAYLYGECGTGKTFLASIIAQDFLKHSKTVLFTKVPSLLDDIKATYNGAGTELDLLDDLKAAHLVVLDDFGMEKATQWAGATLCKILDMRYDERKRTIITSNLSPSELAEKLNNATDGENQNGDRIADRCRELCKPILLKGTSRRH